METLIMDDRDLRLRVSAHLQQLDEPSATLEEMKYALAQGLGEDHWVTEDELAQTIAERCREWRHAPREAGQSLSPVSYTHLRAHETDSYLVCRLLLEKKKRNC